MSPLPDLRVTQSFPLAVTGLDHAGPLYCCDFLGVALYLWGDPCCAPWVSRVAVHWTDIVGITPFSCTSRAATCDLLRQCKGLRCQPSAVTKTVRPCGPWLEIYCPRSPWWGGWWERLIRSIKSSLKKTFGRHSLTRTELETTLHEVESCVNSRPLTYVSDEADAESPLTPAHFLLGHAGGFYERSTPTPVASGSDLALRFAMRESLLNKFWEIWSNDYIRNLPPWRGAQGKCDLREGSVVLVQDDQQPRLRWPLGVITQLFPGRDGVVRTVEVKTASGKLVRSIPRIHDLEILSGSVDDVPDPMPSVYPPETAPRPRGQYVTSRGRVVKPVQRLDL